MFPRVRTAAHTMIIPLLAVVMLSLLTGATSAAAETSITPEGAAHLKQLVEDELLWRSNMAKISGQGIVVGNPVEVIPHETFYEIKLTGVSIFLNPERRLNIGTVAINAMQDPDGAEWRLQAAVPAALVLYDKAGAALANITIGNQHLAATWIPALGIYPKADSLYQNIQIKGLTSDSFNGSIATFRLTADLHNNGDGTWTGPGQFTATDINLDTSGAAAAQLNIKGLDISSHYDGLDAGKGVENRKKILDMISSGKIPAGVEGGKILSSMQQVENNVSSSLNIGGFSIREKNGTPPAAPKAITLDNISFQGGLQGAQQEKSTVHFKSAFNGLKVSSVPAELSGLIPHTVNIETNINDLPFSKMMALVAESIQAPQSPTGSPFEAMPGMLQKYGTSLAIQNSFFKSADMQVDMSGAVSANAAATNGMTGKITLSVKGLDSAISRLQTLAAKPNADAQLMGYASAMTAFMLMGQSGKTTSGETVDDYVFEITPDGKFLLNNMNLMTAVNAGAILNEHVNHANPLIQKISP